MPPLLYRHGVALVQDWAHIPEARCYLGKRHEGIYVGDGARCTQYLLGMAGDLLTYLPEQRAFDLANAVLGVQDE